MNLFGRKKDADRLVSEALELLNAGRTGAAKSKLKQAIDAEPKHALAWYCLGTTYSGEGLLEEAIDCYRNSAEHAPADKQALPLYNMGNALQSLGRLDEAIEVFERATTVDPAFADAWINMGRLLDDCGRHVEAIECYDQALALAPDDVTALSNRGNSLRALGRHEEARANYEKALSIDPDNLAGRVGLGLCLAHLGRPEEGLAVIDGAAEVADHPFLMAERATLLATLKRHDEALACIDRAIGLGIGAPEVYHNRGEILAKLGRVDESIASFDQALELVPHYAAALFGKARVLCNAERYGPAIETIGLYFKYRDGSDDLEEPARAIVMLCQNEGQG